MSRGRWRQRGPGFTDRGVQIRCLSDDQRGVVSIPHSDSMKYIYS